MKLVRLMILALLPAIFFTVAGCGDTSTTPDMQQTTQDMTTTTHD